MAGPCTWDVDPDALGVCSTWNDNSPETRATALQLATLYLWAATGRQYGPCPLTVRPSQTLRGGEILYQEFAVRPGSQAGLGVPGGPFLFGGRWFNSGCASACCGNSACAIVLRGPVADIISVHIGEDEVDPIDYRVDITGGVYLLIRTDGQCWPTCQDFTADEGEPGSFVVDYLIGRELTDALKIAAATLACEYVKDITGGACALPARMTRLSRQGVEVEVEPPSPDEGRTGIRVVDDVIAALNPNGLKSTPLVLSPDLPEACDRVTVWAGGS